jgi:N-acyl-D-aspartate/D-glutamate deacylase
MTQTYDIILRNGTLYDGSGAPPVVGDLAINGEMIVALGDLGDAVGKTEIDVSGLAVAPGFINMLSWAPITLLHDGRSQSDIRQGVTLEVMGESWSEGPLNEEMKREMLEKQGDIKYDITWTTLGEFLEQLAEKGVSTNIASFVGTATVRIHTIGYSDRNPTSEELEAMCNLVREAMSEGAMGVSSALIYAPDCFYTTEELTALAKAAAEYDGLYISHLRSEGNSFHEALEEFITVVRDAQVRGEIYHLKAMGEANWHKMDSVLERIEQARAEGLEITADMYTYTAAGTGLDATMPRWVQEGGHDAWVARLKDPAVRERLRVEMSTPSNEWENVYLMSSGQAKGMLLVGFKNPELKHLTGKTLAEVAEMRGTSPEDTIMDLVIEDDSRVNVVYFVMTEDNLRKQIKRPWVSLCSDSGSLAPEGLFLKSSTHPRAYGTFARFLAKYVRDEQLIPLEEGIRRMTTLPASVLKLKWRGALKPGFYADLAIFDPDKIQDHATFDQPHQYATGMVHVFVNGTQVLKDGEHTGATPGQFVRGPGWRGWNEIEEQV